MTEREKILEDQLRQMIDISESLMSNMEEKWAYENLFLAMKEAKQVLNNVDCEGDNCKL